MPYVTRGVKNGTFILTHSCGHDRKQCLEDADPMVLSAIRQLLPIPRTDANSDWALSLDERTRLRSVSVVAEGRSN